MSPTLFRDVLPALVLIALGGYALWEATGMTTLGRVFPTLASLGLILGGVALIARAAFATPVTAGNAQAASGPILRPLLLLAVLAGWAVLLPVTGFVLTSAAGALAIMAIAEQERPGVKSLVIQAASLIVLVLFLAVVFGRILMVNLP